MCFGEMQSRLNVLAKTVGGKVKSSPLSSPLFFFFFFFLPP
jgi:hypothetical protein